MAEDHIGSPASLQQLAAALGGDITNGQILAPGPGHSPQDRSLSVKLDAGAPEGFLIHSFSGDDPIACRHHVRLRLGLSPRQANGGKRRRAEAEIEEALAAAITAQATSSKATPVVTRYDYTDENGTVLYQVQRHQPKRFTQRRPDGNGGWSYQLGDVRRVLYRLPELLKYPDGTVFVCEGEKDADNVAALGYCATTLSGGSKWIDEHLRVMAGRDLIVLEDDDETGHKKALAAARALHGVAATVRVVKFPGFKDVSDWLEADTRNANKLVETCFDAPLWTPLENAARADDDSDSGGNGGVEPTPAQQQTPTAAPPPTIVASPFAWREPTSLPQRAWLYGRHYIRQFVTCTIAPGGHGKTSLVIVEALALASGSALLGITPTERARVWLWNGEDPIDEVDRRITAAMIQHQIEPQHIEGYLFRNTGRDTPIVLATQTRTGTIIAKPVVNAMIEAIKQNKISALVIDPFVKSHKVNESDNNAIDAVATQWAEIADVTNCAIELLHHPRKTGGAEITVEDSRGAIALINASRSARVLNKMSRQEAEDAGIETRAAWRYFRLDNGKASMAPPPERANWYQLVSVPLGNGDDVGAVAAWTWPDPFAGVTMHDLRAVQKEVGEGGPWRSDIRADNWAGKPIARALKLDLAKDNDKKKVKSMLKVWIRNGMLVEEEGEGRGRHAVKLIKVGTRA